MAGSPVTIEALAEWEGDSYTGCVALTAAARGLPTRMAMLRAGPDVQPRRWIAFRVGQRDYLFRGGILLVGGRMPDASGFVHVNGAMPTLTSNKAMTRLAIAALGASIPAGDLFDATAIGPALRFFRSLGRPVCVKANTGHDGIDVYPGVADEATFRTLFQTVARKHRRVLIEEHVDGTIVRCIFVRPEIVGLRLDRPASVLADGVSTVAALVAAKNADPARNRLANHNPIPLEAENLRQLANQGFALTDVPPAGLRVYLGAISNSSGGADCLSWPERIHPSYPAEVARVCNAFAPYRFGAVDLMVRDYTVPAAPGNHWFIEINSAPGFSSFYMPLEGEPQDITAALFDRLRDEQW